MIAIYLKKRELEPFPKRGIAGPELSEYYALLHFVAFPALKPIKHIFHKNF
jgi:hypothetical protein